MSSPFSFNPVGKLVPIIRKQRQRLAGFNPYGKWNLDLGTRYVKIFSVQGASAQWKAAFNIPRKLIKGAMAEDYTLSQRNIGQWFLDLYTQRVDLPGEACWSADRPLGHGSFGAVALFRHTGVDGVVDDYVVIKNTLMENGFEVPNFRQGDFALSQEAAIQYQLNHTDDAYKEGILFLRSFKAYTDDGIWKYYFEYCPGLNLEELRITYKAWRRYIPELALWYIFHGLVKGLGAMEGGRRFHALERSDILLNRAYVLHLDIKPENTFLGYSRLDPKDQLARDLHYPFPKIADFGLAKLTSDTDDENCADGYYGIGSSLWWSPEQRWNEISKFSDFYPFSSDERHDMPVYDKQGGYNKGRHIVTPKASTYAIGFMMYQLMTLEEPFGLFKQLGQVLNEQNYLADDGMILSDTEMLTLQDLDYSQELRDLVRQCLSLRPNHRPQTLKLYNDTFNGVQSCWKREFNKYGKDKGALAQANKLYATWNEVPQMPPGTFKTFGDTRRAGESFWRRFRDLGQWRDPAIGPIFPPEYEDVPDDLKSLRTPPKEVKNKSLQKKRTAAALDAALQDAGARKILRTNAGGGMIIRDPSYVPSHSDIEMDGLTLAAEQADVLGVVKRRKPPRNRGRPQRIAQQQQQQPAPAPAPAAGKHPALELLADAATLHERLEEYRALPQRQRSLVERQVEINLDVLKAAGELISTREAVDKMVVSTAVKMGFLQQS